MAKKFYDNPRYWYHLSANLNRKEVHLTPRVEGDNRDETEPRIPRICVAPTIEQCLTALPYTLNDSFYIYRTKDACVATEPYDVFDAGVTQEGWITTPTTFVKFGRLHFSDIEKKLEIDQVVDTAACFGDLTFSKNALKWWCKINVEQFVRKAK